MSILNNKKGSQRLTKNSHWKQREFGQKVILWEVFKERGNEFIVPPVEIKGNGGKPDDEGSGGSGPVEHVSRIGVVDQEASVFDERLGDHVSGTAEDGASQASA